jgi:hypothetical protein
MNTTKLFPSLGALLLGTIAATAAPFQPGQVSEDANWFLHADLDNLRNTQVGATLMEAIEKEHGRQLKAVKRMFSLNPFTDLHGVTIYGSGEEDEAVALIHATFQRDHLEDLIGASDGYKTTQHHSNTIHTWKDDDKKVQNGAFFGKDLVIISEHKGLVSDALDVLDKRADGMKALSTQSAFMFGLINLEGIDIQGDEAKLFEKARSLQGRLFEQDGRLHAELVIEAADNALAKRFQKVLDGIVALGELANEDLASLELGMQTSIKDGTMVTATMSIPNDRMLELMEEAGELGDLVD